MNGREEQIEWISGALAGLGVESHARDDWAPRLYAQGVRVLGHGEVILSATDAGLIDHVRMAAKRWEEARKRAAGVSTDSSDDTPGVKMPGQIADSVKESAILAALISAGKPLGRVPAIQAAAGWHRDYRPTPTEWEPWRAAWRTLLIQRRIRRANNPSLGEESLWEVVPVLLTNWPVELEKRRHQNPGLCVTAVMVGPTSAQGTVICGKPETVAGSGSCGEHGEGGSE